MNSITDVIAPVQTTKSDGLSTCAVGLTVIVKISSSPLQITPSNSDEGVTIIVATTGCVDKLVAVNEEIFPTPLLGSPILVLLFVQEYEVVPTVF